MTKYEIYKEYKSGKTLICGKINAKYEFSISRLAGKTKELIKNNILYEDYIGQNYNGYGFKDKTYRYILPPKVIKEIKGIIEDSNKVKKVKVETSQYEKIISWCKRLSKLTDISIEDSIKIALAKLEYKQEQINNLIDIDCKKGVSVRRGTLIKNIEKSNPLRYIKDKEHAENILNANKRHTETNYDDMLKLAHHLESLGDLEKGTAKEFALIHKESISASNNKIELSKQALDNIKKRLASSSERTKAKPNSKGVKF